MKSTCPVQGLRVWRLVVATLTLAGMWLLTSALAAQQNAGLNTLLDQLHASSAAIITSLPSFTCDEQAISRSKNGDTVVKNVQLHSIYREIRNSDPHSSILFLDSRTSPDDGTAISLGKLRPPFWEGGVYWAYSQNVSPTDRKLMVYKIIDPVTLWPGAPAHVMQIAYRGRYETTEADRDFWRTVKGMAWVDSNSGQLLRIEVRIHECSLFWLDHGREQYPDDYGRLCTGYAGPWKLRSATEDTYGTARQRNTP